MSAHRFAVNALQMEPGFSMRSAALPAYHMLCGLALEVAIKAVVVYQGKPLETTHDLNRLADTIDFPRTRPQSDLLDFYAAHVEWSGKYPTPLEKKHQPAREALASHIDLQIDTLTYAEEMSPDSFIKRIFPTNATDWEQFHFLWRTIDELSLDACR